MTATRIEFHAVACALQLTYPVPQFGCRAVASTDHGLHILLIQSGIGPDKAQKSTQQLLADGPWDVIISTGFAGDLKSNSIGAVLIGQEVAFGYATLSHLSSTPKTIMCHPDWVNAALSISWKGEDPLRVGRFVSMDRVLINADDKQRLHDVSGAVGVDMESAAIGEIAQRNDIPLLIVRAISDGVAGDLPVDFNLFLTPTGWVTGIMHIMTTPKCWKGFLHLYRHSKRASRQLTQFFEEFFPLISSIPPSSAPLNN